MPITIRTNELNARSGETGEFVGIDAVTDKTTEQRVAEITAASNAEQTKIQQKGSEVIASIPSDYTELAEDVDDLKSALGGFVYPFPVDGNINTAGQVNAGTAGTYKCTDYIWIGTDSLVFIANFVSRSWAPACTFYKEDKSFISNTGMINGNAIISDIPAEARYIRLSANIVEGPNATVYVVKQTAVEIELLSLLEGMDFVYHKIGKSFLSETSTQFSDDILSVIDELYLTEPDANHIYKLAIYAFNSVESTEVNDRTRMSVIEYDSTGNTIIDTYTYGEGISGGMLFDCVIPFANESGDVVGYAHVSGKDTLQLNFSRSVEIRKEYASNSRYSPKIKAFLKSAYPTNNQFVNTIISEMYIPDNAADYNYIQASAGFYALRIVHRDGSNYTYPTSIRKKTLIQTDASVFMGGYTATPYIESAFYLSDFGVQLTNRFFQENKNFSFRVKVMEASQSIENAEHIKRFYETADTKMPWFYPNQVTEQNYYDDRLDVKDGVMIRTDKFVWNQGNLGEFASAVANYSSLDFLGDSSHATGYKYFYWNQVQTNQDEYDFSAIGEWLDNCAENGKRTNLRLFPTCCSDNPNTYGNYKISFPVYVAQFMSNNGGQTAIWTDPDGNGHLLLDFNLDVVYAEYAKLIEAFSDWLDNTEIRGIPAKKLILYIDFGFIGPWGEGAIATLQFNGVRGAKSRYLKKFIDECTDIQFNIGLTNTASAYQQTNAEQYNLEFLDEKEMQNNAGRVGLFIDNVGAKLERLNTKTWSNFLVDGVYLKDKFDEYGQRGDFFTGEFAMWADTPRWGNDQALWAIDTFKRAKAPYFRVHNIIAAVNNKSYNLEFDKYSMRVINSALASVGFRFVITPFRKTASGSNVTVIWALTNIGLTNCRFDIYKLYYRIHNLDNDQYTDVAIDYDLRTLMPNNDGIPCKYAIGNGEIFTDTLAIPYTNYDICIIGKDKDGLQNPLFFSNYGRKTDGSYAL